MAALQYKDDHNRIAYLGRERGSEDFTDILSYLESSPLRLRFNNIHTLEPAPSCIGPPSVKTFGQQLQFAQIALSHET
ncbi:hypothetical protein Tco_0065047 [Tanacetum coccineum]